MRQASEVTSLSWIPSEAVTGLNKAAFDSGFEDTGFVAFEVRLDALEIGDGFVHARELLFNLRYNAFLFIDWCERK